MGPDASTKTGKEAVHGRGKQRNPAAFFVSFAILFFFWILFSGRFDLFHLGLGAISCLMVAGVSHALLFPCGIYPGIFRTWIRFAAYLPWLIVQIFLANLHVLYLTFHPRMMEKINPKVIEFDSRLTSDVARTTFANSITLTPGTITVQAGVMGFFAVHCIDDASGTGLPGEMEQRIDKVFQAHD